MKKNEVYPALKFGLLLLLSLNLVISCKPGPIHLNTAEIAGVKDSVSRMAANIAQDISNDGPAAWLNYFEDSPDFFMANEGQLVFKDSKTAKKFIINTLVKNIPVVKLQWDHLRIDPITSVFAAMGAGFHEDQVNSSGKKLAYDGYFTGIAHYDGHSWKLRNLHWSIMKPINTTSK